MARGIEDETLEDIDESYAGKWAAFSQNGKVVRCCELEYKECSRDRPPQPDGDDQEKPQNWGKKSNRTDQSQLNHWLPNQQHT